MPDVLELLAQTDEGVCAVDADQRIVLWNQRAQEIMGFERGEVVGRLCYNVFAGADEYCSDVCQRDCTIFRAAESRGKAPSHEIRTHTKDGREIWLHIANVVVPSAQQSLDTVVHIFRDITAERQSREALQRVLGAISGVSAELAKAPAAAPAAAPAPAAASLSRREAEVLRLLCDGAHPRQIAETLFISVATARNHVKRILRKLGVHTSLEAVAWATRHRIP